MHETGCSGLVHWDDPGGWDGEGRGRRVLDDVFLELFCFFDDPVDAGNLISGSSAFSKSSLNI